MCDNTYQAIKSAHKYVKKSHCRRSSKIHKYKHSMIQRLQEGDTDSNEETIGDLPYIEYILNSPIFKFINFGAKY